MVFYSKYGTLLIVIVMAISISMALAKSVGQQDKDLYASQLDVAGDDGSSMERSLLNYLYARQMANRIRSNMDSSDYQRKRSYWKQCAFNAVSCFGKK